MQTNLAEFIRDTEKGQEADKILRACVHCGFCTATCPTYQLLGDELDGPRGRIYQIKQILEGETATDHMRQHLDRCLTCRSCETTCPSGVQYARLLEIGRELVEEQTRRPLLERGFRQLLLLVMPYRRRFGAFLRLGQWLRPLLPNQVRKKLPLIVNPGLRPATHHVRRVLLLDGCVQPTAAPQINSAAARILDRLGISAISVSQAGCCGALPQHLSREDLAADMARRNIDAWLPELEAGAEAILVTASGCAAHMMEYPRLLAHDVDYAAKAERITAAVKGMAELLQAEDLAAFDQLKASPPIAFHAPCTLQHGLKLDNTVSSLLQRLGFNLTPVADAHLCCGSAGTYSLLQPELSQKLRNNKLQALKQGNPERIATANIGCLLHLQEGSEIPVSHWIELLDEALLKA